MFANYYNTTSICMASRATIMTGMYEYKTGCNFMHGPLRSDLFQQSYPVLLREAGYYKNEFIRQYADQYPHSSRAYGAWAHDFLKEAKASGKPFCLSISFKAPHLPFTPDPYFDSVYAGKKYIPPKNYGAENAFHLADQAKTGRQYNNYVFWRESEESYQDAIRKYNQLIHGVDHAVGMIRNSLDELGLAENTVIIFTSDNGYSCGAHSFGGKVLPYEEASKSPLIIYDPHASEDQRGIIRDRVTGNIDMAPTILSYAGLPVPENMDGKNLIPLLEDENGMERETVTLMNMWGNDEIQAMGVVSSEWKYIYWQYEDERMETAEELFHIGQDRLEMKNVAWEEVYREKLTEMRQIYDQHLQYLSDHAVDFHS
jgi:arylsulfatase A-like enzyme